MASLKNVVPSSQIVIAPTQTVLQAFSQEFVPSCLAACKCSFSQQEPIDDSAPFIEADSGQSTCISAAAALAAGPFGNWPNAITTARTVAIAMRVAVMVLSQFTMLYNMKQQTNKST